MNSDNLVLSSTSTRQLERMIDDAAWLTYPLHLAVGIIKDLVYVLFLISAVIVYMIAWMMTAYDNRAEETKNFVTEETIYRINLATNEVTTQKAGYAVDKDVFDASFNGCMGTGEQLKNTTWWDHNWLADKSDVFQSAYIASSHNLAALSLALHRAKIGESVYSFHYACTDAMGWHSPLVIPNAPVVYISFRHRTDESIMDSANAKYNWFTGMCLASANCADKDFVPRNDSIYADAIYPQVTANQGAVLKALKATGTPEFWITAAHANGIYGRDSEFTDYAAKQAVQLARDISHKVTPSEEFADEFEVAIICCLLFIGFIGVWIARRIYKFAY